MSASGAKVTNDSGTALAGDGIQVDGGMFLRGGFTGTGELGAVRLLGAHISHHLDATGTTISNNSGPALLADGLQVDGDLYLRHDFTATGTGEPGAVGLGGAHISGEMVASGAKSTNHSGPALNAGRLRVDGDLVLRDGFTATGGSNGDAVRLSAAHVGGLKIDLSGIHNLGGGPGGLRVDGLVYTGLPVGPTVAEWLAVLAHRTPGYAAQPYRQLADATRAAGHDGDTRKILIAQRRDQLNRRAVTARSERAWARFTGVVLGFGYQPWRALLWLLAVVAIAIALTIIGGNHGGLAHTERTGSAGTPCTTVERVGVGIDLGLPLIKTTARDTCTTTTTPAGRTITATGWALQLAAWALATLFIAGFTGAVRKT